MGEEARVARDSGCNHADLAILDLRKTAEQNILGRMQRLRAGMAEKWVCAWQAHLLLAFLLPCAPRKSACDREKLVVWEGEVRVERKISIEKDNMKINGNKCREGANRRSTDFCEDRSCLGVGRFTS